VPHPNALEFPLRPNEKEKDAQHHTHPALGLAIGPLQVGLVIAGMALFIGAVASLALSYVTGELRGERDRMATAARAYREQRDERDQRDRK